MEELKTLLRQVDDDYLMGISNKGIVKRAYKDLLKEHPEVLWQGEEAKVSLAEATCILRAPLGESSCSCPSRSICRHVITSVLWLRQMLPGDPAKEAESGEDGQKSPDCTETRQEVERILGEVLELSPEKLVRICGSRRMERFFANIQADGLPSVKESSVVTIELPWEQVTVKLLDPFAHSACTCHSRELCVHKAQAALIYQLAKHKITLEELKGYGRTKDTFDREQVREACAAVREELCRQIATGLSRQSPETAAAMERLAVITHRAELPSLESLMREAASEYEQYFSRSAAFRTGELLETILSAYALGKRLEHAGSEEELRSLAGTFRDTYEPVGNLHLFGVGSRSFHSKTGYEGEIYYFLEPDQKCWYTWTDARPVFYEGIRKRPAGASDGMQAPWGLNCTREQMQRLEFVLKGAKAALGNRLSVSRESTGEPVGEYAAASAFPECMIERDYEKLIETYFRKETGNTGQRRERLALVEAHRQGKAAFEKVGQRFSWSLFDRAGKKLYISLRYTKEEKLLIRFLERLEQRLRVSKPGRLLVFGFLYMDEGGRLCLYPIEFFRLPEKNASDPEQKTDQTLEMSTVKPQEADTAKPKEARLLPTEETLKRMEQYQRESIRLLEDLFISGLASADEETARQFLASSEEAKQLGLHMAGTWLGQIGTLLQEKRHRMHFEPEPAIEAMERFYQYMNLCGQKLSCDRALRSMQNTEKGEEDHESE